MSKHIMRFLSLQGLDQLLGAKLFGSSQMSLPQGHFQGEKQHLQIILVSCLVNML